MKQASAPGITFVAHPPEREKRRPLTLACGCSCCCCCLHTIGGVAGAVAFAAVKGSASAGPGMVAHPSPTAEVGMAPGQLLNSRSPEVALSYWGLVALTATLIATLGGEVGLWGVLLGLPAIQLGVSLVLLLLLLLFSAPVNRPAALRYLGWLTLGSIAGCAGGIAAIFGLLTLLH